MEFELHGLDELADDLKKCVKKYPDIAYDAMEKTGKDFKNRVIKITFSAVDRHTGNLIKGYRVGKPYGLSTDVCVDFNAEGRGNPHFHLIEQGHEIVTQKTKNGKTLKNGGKHKGFVPGRLIVEQARREYREILPEKLENTVDILLKESGLG